MSSDDDYLSDDFYSDLNDHDGLWDEKKKADKASLYTVLKVKDLINRLDDYVAKVSSFLSVSREDAILLLMYHDWSYEDVYEEWFADEDKLRTILVWKNPDAKKVCYLFNRMKSLGCVTCTCPENYITASIEDLTLKSDFISMFGSEKDFKEFGHNIVESYIQFNKKIKWCPAPNCENTIEYYSGNYNVTCDCSYSFCWNCTNEDHRPVDCESVRKWNYKNSCESENADWILAFTKPCPKCKRPIENTYGKKHITCGAPCYHEFCWTCLWEYNKHGTCNRHNPTCIPIVENDEVKKRRAKTLMDRYMHYYERWSVNLSSRESARVSLEQLQTYQQDLISNIYDRADGKFITEARIQADVNFLTIAWTQIIECRRVLKWTYAYGYFIPDKEKTKKQFFEYLQGELEAGLEKLHKCAAEGLVEYLKKDSSLMRDPLKINDFISFRDKVTSLTEVIRIFFENLVRGIENDFADGCDLNGI